jgi:L-ascorbate metabolism protein UlaG (beta-lactamase superfamily)
MSTYPVSDHCDGERFFNPHRNARPLRDVITWMRTRERTPWPRSLPLAAHPPPPPAVGRGEVAVTFIGHSTFLLRTASAVILTDPVFTSHAGPFGRMGPRRVRPPAIAPSSLPPVDLVLVSHNHYDHLQPSSLRLFADRATYVAPLGVASQLRVPPKGGNYRAESGQPSRSEVRTPSGVTPTISSSNPVVSALRRNIVELDWWESATSGGAEITCVPAQHFSARTAWDRNQTLWCGFIVRVDDVTIYFGGDSGYSPQFGEIGARFPSIDVALLPIGAYEPRWFMSPVHMNPEEAVRAHFDVKARASIGMHFGTFQLTDEGIDEPLRALERARAAQGVNAAAFGVLDFGETKLFGK